MKFNDLFNIINEGISSPYEKVTGIKRNVTFEEVEPEGELGAALKDEMSTVAPYGYGDKSGNPGAQSELDDILGNFLGQDTEDELILQKVGTHPGTTATMHVYSVPSDILPEFRPYNLVAYSEEDLGDTESLFPLGKFYSVLIGVEGGQEGGIPKLKDLFYNGPAADLPSNKEPDGGMPPEGVGDAGLDYDQIRRDVEAAKDRGQMK